MDTKTPTLKAKLIMFAVLAIVALTLVLTIMQIIPVYVMPVIYLVVFAGLKFISSNDNK